MIKPQKVLEVCRQPLRPRSPGQELWPPSPPPLSHRRGRESSQIVILMNFQIYYIECWLFLRFEGKAASRNMRGLEGRRLPCGTEVRLRQRGAGTPPSPSPSPLLLLLPLRLPLRPVLVSCTVALLGVTHSHAHCVFLVLYSSCFFLRRFNRSSLP